MKKWRKIMCLILCSSMFFSLGSGISGNTKTIAAMEDTLERLPAGSWNYTGYLDENILHVQEDLLKNTAYWEQFITWYREKADTDGAWRGEFWGKTLRGACMTYTYTQDAELYRILEGTVKEMLTLQEANGNITSYPANMEFTSWDMWCRKYVLLGMQAFYGICTDASLKTQVMDFMCKSADYILAHVGPAEEGKIPILQTTNQWDGMAACSALGAFVEMYNLSGQQKYLDFATHIVNSGGCTKANLFDLAYENELAPYQYPNTKAYEMIVIFEGLVEYYRATGEERWLITAKNYAYKLMETDVTLTGHAGNDWEYLNNSTVEQSNPAITDIGLDFCNTISWMRVCEQLLRLTGEAAFGDEIEKTMYNAVIGAINSDNCTHNAGMMFDSYGVVLMNKRGRGISGFIDIFSCCNAMGSVATGLIPNVSVMESKKGPYFTLYIPGDIDTKTPSGAPLSMKVDTQYPVAGEIAITVNPQQSETFSVFLRIPGWSANTVLKVNGQELSVTPGTYVEINRNWNPGDIITLSLDMRTRLVAASTESENEDTQYHVALLRGPLALARDRRTGEDISQVVDIPCDANGYVDVNFSSVSTFDNTVEVEITLRDGSKMHLVDYSSAGKTWDDTSMLTVWMPTKAYWEVNTSQPVIIRNLSTEKLFYVGEDGKLMEDADVNAPDPELSQCAFLLEEDNGSGYYRIRSVKTGKYLEIQPGEAKDTNGAKIVEAERSKSKYQLWLIKSSVFNRVTIASAANSKILSKAADSNYIHIWDNIGVDLQLFTLTNVTCDTSHLPDVSESVSEETYVTDMNWEYCTVLDYGTAQMLFIEENMLRDGNPLSINGKEYPKGISISPSWDTPAEIVLDIEGMGYTTFTATVGKDGAAAGNGLVNFKVIADGQVVAESGEIGWNDARELTADITGCKTLTLSVDCASDGFPWDYAAWGDPKLSGPKENRKDDNRVFLSDMAYASYEGYPWLFFDKAYYEGTVGYAPISMRITGATVRTGFNKGVTMHPNPNSPARLTYNLNGKFKNFYALAGKLADIGGSVHLAEINVYVDGVLKAASGPIKSGDTLYEIDIDVTDAQTLVLEVTDGGDGYAYDATAFGSAYFTINPEAFARENLRNVLDAMSQLEPSNYTEESYQALSEAIAAGTRLVDTETATVEELELALQQIKAAYKNLVLLVKPYFSKFEVENGDWYNLAERTSKGIFVSADSPEGYIPDNCWVYTVPKGFYKLTLRARISNTANANQELMHVDLWDGIDPNRLASVLSQKVLVSDFAEADQWTDLTFYFELPYACEKLRPNFYHYAGANYELDSFTLEQYFPADKTNLETSIASASQLTQSEYTPESWNAFENALSTAKELLALPDATQEDVDTATETLLQAKDNLVKAAVQEPSPSPSTSPSATPSASPSPSPSATPSPSPTQPGTTPDTPPSTGDGNVVHLAIALLSSLLIAIGVLLKRKASKAT